MSLLFAELEVAPWCDGSSDRSFMVDTLSYLSLQGVNVALW